MNSILSCLESVLSLRKQSFFKTLFFQYEKFSEQLKIRLTTSIGQSKNKQAKAETAKEKRSIVDRTSNENVFSCKVHYIDVHT